MLEHFSSLRCPALLGETVLIPFVFIQQTHPEACAFPWRQRLSWSWPYRKGKKSVADKGSVC